MIECSHCNGFGSSFKDPGDERCSKCGGTGLKPEPACYVAAPKIGCTCCKGDGTLILDTYEGPKRLTCSSCEGSGLKVDADAILVDQAKQGMEEVRAERINDRVMSGFYYGGPE